MHTCLSLTLYVIVHHRRDVGSVIDKMLNWPNIMVCTIVVVVVVVVIAFPSSTITR